MIEIIWISLEEHGLLEFSDTALAAVALATGITLVAAAAPAGVLKLGVLELAAMLVDAAFFPEFDIISNALVSNGNIGVPTEASCTVATLIVVVRLAVAPASIPACPRLVEAALFRHTTVVPSLRLSAHAGGVFVGCRHRLRREVRLSFAGSQAPSSVDHGSSRRILITIRAPRIVNRAPRVIYSRGKVAIGAGNTEIQTTLNRETTVVLED